MDSSPTDRSSTDRSSADRPPTGRPPTSRPPRIVAELGRPETPEETAARKAENSRRHRSNQTMRNLVLALVASLGIVLFLVLVVVRPDGATRKPFDYLTDARQAQPDISETLVAPRLPKGWSANHDALAKGSDGVVSWSIGFVTPKTQYISLTQGLSANATWVSNQLDSAPATGSASIGGLDWTVYNQRTVRDIGNYAYSMTTTVGGSSIVLHGTASTPEFTTLAGAIAAQLAESTR
jgi:hypothetical protein